MIKFSLIQLRQTSFLDKDLKIEHATSTHSLKVANFTVFIPPETNTTISNSLEKRDIYILILHNVVNWGLKQYPESNLIPFHLEYQIVLTSITELLRKDLKKQ